MLNSRLGEFDKVLHLTEAIRKFHEQIIFKTTLFD